MTHFAENYLTACGVSTSNRTLLMSEEGAALSATWDTCQHTSDPEFVTCDACKKSVGFKKALEEEK